MQAKHILLAAVLPIVLIASGRMFLRQSETPATQEAIVLAPMETVELSGHELVALKCSGCHALDRVYAARKTHPEWAATVDKMIRYSDQMGFLNQAQRAAVIDVLANREREILP